MFRMRAGMTTEMGRQWGRRLTCDHAEYFTLTAPVIRLIHNIRHMLVGVKEGLFECVRNSFRQRTRDLVSVQWTSDII